MSKDVVIEPLSMGAAIQGRLRSAMAMGTEDHLRLEFVRPGDCRVSLDGTSWTTVTVTDEPAH